MIFSLNKVWFQILQKIYNREKTYFFGAPYMHLTRTNWFHVCDEQCWRERGRKAPFEARRSFERKIVITLLCVDHNRHRRIARWQMVRISHFRANLINNGIAAYVLTNGQTERDLRRGKYRIDRRADQSGANFDRDHVAPYLKQSPLRATKLFK